MDDVADVVELAAEATTNDMKHGEGYHELVFMTKGKSKSGTKGLLFGLTFYRGISWMD